MRIKHQFGNDAGILLRALDQSPVSSVQLNPWKSFKEHWKSAEVPWYPHGRILSERPAFTMDPLYHAGAYYSQESSSMILWHILKTLIEKKNIRCLDLCAAPGGKSLLLSAFLNGEGMLYSNEVVPMRNAVLRENLTKSGRNNFIVTHNEASQFGKLKSYFDLVLVDAPCSGEGMFRKDNEARSEWSESNVLMCAVRQNKILSEIIPCIKPGGILVYSTCTFSQEENESICEWLTSENGFEKIDIPVPSDWNIKKVEGKNFSAHQFLPGFTPGEGFFICAFRKTEDHTVRSQGKSRKSYFRNLSLSESKMLERWIKPECLQNTIINPDGIVFDTMESAQELNLISDHLHYTQCGIPIGKITTREFIPDHGLAMSLSVGDELPRIELDLDKAIQYLRKEDPHITGNPGWTLCTYQNIPIGFLKILQGRSNNYYPKEWRIRK